MHIVNLLKSITCNDGLYSIYNINSKIIALHLNKAYFRFSKRITLAYNKRETGKLYTTTDI